MKRKLSFSSEDDDFAELEAILLSEKHWLHVAQRIPLKGGRRCTHSQDDCKSNDTTTPPEQSLSSASVSTSTLSSPSYSSVNHPCTSNIKNFEQSESQISQLNSNFDSLSVHSDNSENKDNRNDLLNEEVTMIDIHWNFPVYDEQVEFFWQSELELLSKLGIIRCDNYNRNANDMSLNMFNHNSDIYDTHGKKDRNKKTSFDSDCKQMCNEKNDGGKQQHRNSNCSTITKSSEYVLSNGSKTGKKRPFSAV